MELAHYSHRPLISFCTTCMNRLEELQETYLINLTAAPSSEFVLLNYGSKDGLDEWAAALPNRVAYYRAPEPTHFHMAHAKNVAHRLARGQVLVNLDGDAFLTSVYVQKITHIFSYRVAQLACYKVSGQIAIGRGLFHAVGGYDESFAGWGYEDDDLRERVKAVGGVVVELDPVEIPPPVLVPQSGERRMANYAEPTPQQLTWDKNYQRSQENLARGEFVANRNLSWGKALVTCSFTT